MESYLEISMMHQLVITYLAMHLATFYSYRLVDKAKSYPYLLVITLVKTLMWFPNSIYIVVLLEICALIFWFRYEKKWYLMMQAIQGILMIASYFLLNGSFHNLMFFISINQNMLWLCLLEIIAIILIRGSNRFQLVSETLIYHYHLYLNQEQIEGYGYLDTGNLLSYQGLSVIFIDDEYQALFEKEKAIQIDSYSVHGLQKLVVYYALIEIEKGGVMPVYVSLCSLKHLVKPCKLLLNMKLMMR